jgi:lysylphosphatidylglycerol synthetase-like protein (DUF2156 family)
LWMTVTAMSSVASIRPTKAKDSPHAHSAPSILEGFAHAQRVALDPRGFGINRKGVSLMVLILALLLVLILFGAGFAVHLLWIAAVVLLILWVVGFAVGRGESAGSHRFYRW